MEIVYDDKALTRYMSEAVSVSNDRPVLIDAFLNDAIEIDVDALSDGDTVHVAGIMEHIEEAGIHSGDSACSLPPYSLPVAQVNEIKRQTIALAKALNVKGLMNVQFAIQDDEIYLIEVNPRASRTVPFVAKAINSPIAAIAAKVMAGAKLEEFTLKDPVPGHFAVKEVVMPWARFPGVDVLLGPEMKSTGEVMGQDTNFASAFFKAQLGAGTNLPTKGQVFVSVRNQDKYDLVPIVRRLTKSGFHVIATSGTADYLQSHGLDVSKVYKMNEGLRPHALDVLKNGEIQLMINTTDGKRTVSDGRSLRQAALMMKVPYFTTLAASKAAVQSITKIMKSDLEVKSLQDWG